MLIVKKEIKKFSPIFLGPRTGYGLSAFGDRLSAESRSPKAESRLGNRAAIMGYEVLREIRCCGYPFPVAGSERIPNFVWPRLHALLRWEHGLAWFFGDRLNSGQRNAPSKKGTLPKPARA
jgi:hypothetical protein